MLPQLFFATNVIELGILTNDDIQVFFDGTAEHARDARLIGGTSTSLEDAGSEIQYRLLDGVGVAEHIPRLQSLYENEFREIAQRVFGRDLIPSPNIVNGANVNLLEGAGGRYEWHYDSNPFTGLLVLSPASASLGGRLLFGRDYDVQVALSMRPGDLLFFDARKSAHAVEALQGASCRATAPMNYFAEGERIVRPPDLDTALYG
ncbi:2OG-Fe(II) oxygenase [Promicromonospora sp. NPDC023805]|uniref:2OG-Fe(II) oxygenase n=1 Tax=Promicromonospora sp. NPDC023805 TaxID=3154696 RepID=UPI0033FC449E